MIIWNVCIVISIIFLLLSGYNVLFSKKANLNKVLVYFVLIGFFAYYPSYLVNYSFLNATFANVINLLQIITVNSDNYVALQSTIPEGLMFHFCIVLRAMAHVCIPILVVYAAFSVILYYWDRFRFQFFSYGKKNIYVFTCLNSKIEGMVQDIYEKDRKSMFIIFENSKLIESVNYMSQINLAQSFSIQSVMQKIKNKNLYFFCFREDMNKNIVDGLKLIQFCSELDKDIQNRIHIYIFSETSELDELMIDAIGKNYLDVRIVDRYRSIVYQLLTAKPLYQVLDNENRKLSVLIIGFSKLSQEAFKTILWCGQLKSVELDITVVLQDSETMTLEAIKSECPELFFGEYALDFHVANIDSETFGQFLQEKCQDANYIIVSRETDELNLKTAVYLRRLYYKMDGLYQKKPFISVYIDTKENRNAILAMTEYEIYPFGEDETLYTYEELINAPLEQLAQNIHFAYAEMFSKTGKIDVFEETLNYKKYEVQKRSNLAAALHIQYKLWQLGYRMTDDESGIDELRLLLNTIPLEILAEIEHNRWVAFHRTEGWIAAPVEAAQNPKYQALSNKGKSTVLKMHPDICSYQSIPERSEIFKRDDTRNLDTALIRAIPDILTHKWSDKDNKKNLKKYGVQKIERG